MQKRVPIFALGVLLASLGAAGWVFSTPARIASSDAQLLDTSDGSDWPGYGRTFGEQHFSPLREVNDGNVGKLGLAWSMDLGVGNPATIPVAVDGIFPAKTMDLSRLSEFLGEKTTINLAGLVIGMFFGVCAQRSRFCLR